MPNLVPPATDVPSATAYHNRIMTHAPDGFTPVMTLYPTDNTDKSVLAAKQSSIIEAFKLYPAGATTNSAFGVSTIKAMYHFLRRWNRTMLSCRFMAKLQITTSTFLTEKRLYRHHAYRYRRKFPKLRIILEHITTLEAVQFVESSSNQVAATITAHHLLFNRNDMLVGGIKPVHYCLPILKRDIHREALLKAATSATLLLPRH